MKHLASLVLFAMVLLTGPAVLAEELGKNTEPFGGQIQLPVLDLAVAPKTRATSTFPSLDVPKNVPDNNPALVLSVLDVPVGGVVTDVNLRLNSITHTCVPDLRLELKSPSGTTVPLLLAWTEGGIFTGFGCPQNFLNTVLDDDAPTNLQAGTAPFTGSFNVEHVSVPARPLSIFKGEPAAGTWTLALSDRAGGDTGILDAWAIEITIETPDHFKCYKAKDLKAPKFAPIGSLPLDDEFGSGTASVKKPSLVCAPADKAGSGVTQPEIFLCCYAVKGPSLQPPRTLDTTDQFGTLRLRLNKPSMLCQPCTRVVVP